MYHKYSLYYFNNRDKSANIKLLFIVIVYIIITPFQIYYFNTTTIFKACQYFQAYFQAKDIKNFFILLTLPLNLEYNKYRK